MTQTITTAQLRRQIEGDGEAIARLLRVLPIWIEQEEQQWLPATPRVLRRLRAHLRMVTELALEPVPYVEETE
jgi:hypothetical protein